MDNAITTLQNAEYNLKNLATTKPIIKNDPLYQIVVEQISACLSILELEEEDSE